MAGNSAIHPHVSVSPRFAADSRAIEAEAEHRRRLNKRNRRQRELYGPAHRRRRRQFAQRLERGEEIRCPRCNQVIGPDQQWDLGHDDYNPAIERPEHRECNRAEPANHLAGVVTRLEILGDLSYHDDPELHAEHEQDEEAPVIRRLPSADLVEVPHHPRGILARKPDRGLRKRYLVTHANEKKTTKPAPMAIQTHMTSPNPRFP